MLYLHFNPINNIHPVLPNYKPTDRPKEVVFPIKSQARNERNYITQFLHFDFWSTIETINTCTYVCISSSAQGSLPHEASEDINLDGYLIPKGAILIASLSACHLDPDLWDEPTKFKPDRFLDKDGNVVKNDNLVPFSLGMEI